MLYPEYEEKSGGDFDPWIIVVLVSVLVLVVCILTGCGSSRQIMDGQHQARLVEVKRMPRSVDAVKLVTPKGDTLYLLNRNPYMGQKKWFIGDWYTVQYDSSKTHIINGKKYHPARAIHNR